MEPEAQQVEPVQPVPPHCALVEDVKHLIGFGVWRRAYLLQDGTALSVLEDGCSESKAAQGRGEKDAFGSHGCTLFSRVF